MKKAGVFTLMFILLIINLKGQKSILEEINTKLSKTESGLQNSNPGNTGVDSSKQYASLNDSLARIASNDTLAQDSANMHNSINVDPKVDSQLFQKRIMQAKKPLTANRRVSEEGWSKELKISNNVRYEKQHMLDTSFSVFGWHPYWCGKAYESYNYSLLSMIAYFSYEVEPTTGFYKTIHNWKKTAMVDSANKHNCDVLLTLTNFGTKNNRVFLSSADAQKNLISTAITLIRERNAQGLNLDFENVPADVKTQFTNFIIALGTSLKAEDEEYILTVALPPVDFHKVYDFTQIDLYVDLYIMMGYEYHGVNSPVAGPVAPLSDGNKWGAFTLENSIDDYIAKGIKPKKLLLGLPYYGAEWITKDLRLPSVANNFVKYYSYRQAKRIAGKNGGDLDKPSMSKFYAYSDRAYNYRQLWFEDTATLGAKYDFIKEKQIGGLGIWALGYDNGHDELWKLLADKFAYTDKQVKELERSRNRLSFRRILAITKRLIKNPKSIITRPRSFLRIFGALAGVSFIGLFIVIRYGHRFKRLLKLILKGGLAGIIILTVAIIFIFLKYFDFKELLFLIGGFLIGLVLFFAFTRRYISEKDLP